MSYWVFKDLNEDALCAEDEDPIPGPIEAPNGVWVGEIRKFGDRYQVYRITKTTTEPTTGEHTSIYKLAGSFHSITKDQYETYQEFGLFDDRS